MNTKLLIILSVAALLFLAGCSKETYVCYNGHQVDKADECPVYPTITVIERKAAQAADNFARAYTLTGDLQFTRVNIYVEEGDWFSDVIFTNRQTKEVDQVKLKIDGRTSTVTCIENCAVLGIQQPALNETSP